MRALEIWRDHPDLVIACLDARAILSAYEMDRTRPRDMTPDQVDLLNEMYEATEREMGGEAVGRHTPAEFTGLPE